MEDKKESDDRESSDGSETNESFHVPEISPVSGSSSGFFSCGSASSSNCASKPNTPTNFHPSDKSDDESLCQFKSKYRSKNSNLTAVDDLAIRRQDESDQDDRDSMKDTRLSVSLGTASTSKISKLRCKHRRKHTSLDDEIVIYESDSSLQIDTRRRNIHVIYTNRMAHQNLNRGAESISRRKSEENSAITQPSCQIVSILKRKDSSTSSNTSLVTFSPNVKDMEPASRRGSHRQGILKKRSSLDESMRSQSSSSASSESEKGCLLRSGRRRNSSEEINNHGILKQKSYDSSGGGSAGVSSGGCETPNTPSVQGILKKPSLTPSDNHTNEQPTKHVSISEAVILAAAELYKDMIITDENESYIKPILKLDNDHQLELRPKPILKKNHSSESEEIRSILKSRKSSQEEL